MKLSLFNTDFLNALQHILRSDQLYTDPADCWLYSYDNGRHRGLPQAVVFPDNTLDVQNIIKCCYYYDIPVIARGRGTGTPGGTVPVKGGLVMSFEKMDKLIQLDASNKFINVQTGILNQTVQHHAQPAGLFWVPDPGSSAFCTVGGNIAYNAGGPRAVKYGATREHVLGLTAVTGTGEIIHTGGFTTKGAVGYDLTRLLIGSEGTLAIMTEAVLKLTPLPSVKKTFQALYKNISSAVQAVLAVMNQPFLPSALEFLDPACVNLIDINPVYLNLSAADSALKSSQTCLLLIDTDDNDPTAYASILSALQNAGLLDIHFADNPQDIKNIWAARTQLSQKLRRLSPRKISEDVVVPISEIPELLDYLSVLSHRYNINIVSFGHIGNGNMHINLLINHLSEPQNITACLSDLFDKTISLKGTLSGEHGIGLEKMSYISRVISPASLQIMKNIKQVFDPRNILNPGKIF